EIYALQPAVGSVGEWNRYAQDGFVCGAPERVLDELRGHKDFIYLADRGKPSCGYVLKLPEPAGNQVAALEAGVADVLEGRLQHVRVDEQDADWMCQIITQPGIHGPVIPTVPQIEVDVEQRDGHAGGDHRARIHAGTLGQAEL